METAEILGDLKRIEVSFQVQKQLINYLKSRYVKIRRTLLLCSVLTLFNYLIIIFNIIKLHTTVKTGYPWPLIIILSVIYISFAIFIWFRLKINIYKPTESNSIKKEFFNFKVQTANLQIEFLKACVITYSPILITSCLFCWFDKEYSAYKIIQTTMPVGIIIYGAGLFLLLKLNRIRKTYTNNISIINKSLVGQSNEQ